MLFRLLLSMLAAIAAAATPVTRTPCPATWPFGRPGAAPRFSAAPLFPGFAFKEPVYARLIPGSAALMVVELGGRLVQLSPTGETSEACILDDYDTYSVAFHPDFAANRQLFVFANGPRSGGPRFNRIFRLNLAADGRCDQGPRTEIIAWASDGHNGGDLAFGDDTFLYISAGDGSNGSDYPLTGQDPSDLLSAILRLDIDHPTAGKAYAVPADNPFRTLAGARAELWAYGLRNPWRMSFNPGTADLLVGDVGQDAWESIDRVRGGENFGWSVYEGSHPFRLERPLGPTPRAVPLIEHPHQESRSITGGLVYRGALFPELMGWYIYGDYITGRVWGLRYDQNGVIDQRLLASTPLSIVAFAEDSQREVVIVDYGGALYRLAPRSGPDAPAIPAKLSQTGLFRDTAALSMNDCLIPYDVNAPLWSDGATKERFLGLPGAETANFSARGPWAFPSTTTFVKTFKVEDRPVETRVLSYQEGNWEGYSFRWNERGDDADLVADGGDNRDVRGQSWHFPSRAECGACHTRAAGFVLGFKTAQINRTFSYSQWGERPQLEVLNELHVANIDLSGGVEAYDRLADPYDASQSLEARSRAYLEGNCAICHVKDGGGNSSMDLAYTTPLAETKIVDATPEHDAFDLPGARIVAPGHPESSVLFHRLGLAGDGQMPPLARRLVDSRGLALFDAWIRSLSP